MVRKQTKPLEFNPFRFDPQTGELRNGEQVTVLLPKDSLVLKALLDHAGEMMSKEELHACCWPQMQVVSNDVLKSSIRRIRKALGDDFQKPVFIETVSRRGYRFIRPAQSAQGGARVEQAAACAGGGLVGRRGELARLHQGLAAAEAGEFALLVVAGEAGIGKTTLLEAFIDSLAGQERATLLQGTCIDCQGPAEPYHPLFDAMRQLAGEIGRDELARLLRRVAPMWLIQLPWLVEVDERKSLEASLQGASSQRMQRELLALTEELSRERPLVLVIEDMHWGDSATLELLDRLPRVRPAPRGLLVIGTCRTDEHAEHPIHRLRADLRMRGRCDELELQPFTVAEVEACLVGRFRPPTLPPELAAWLHEYSSGNPLFLGALIDQGVRKGWLKDDGGLYWEKLQAEEIERIVPHSLRELVAGRQEQLPPAEQSCLEVASVAGQLFQTGLLTDEVNEEVRYEELCERLIRTTGFIRRAEAPEQNSLRHGSCFAFRHALYHRLVYNRIPMLRREFLHRAVGNRLESVSGERSDEQAVVLAMHYELGGDFLKAIRYRCRAGEIAMARHAYREVIEQMNRGLALLPKLPEEQLREREELPLLLPLGSAHLATHGYASPKVERIFSKALMLSTSLKSQGLLAILCGLGFYYLVKDNFIKMQEIAGLFARVEIPGQTSLARTCGHYFSAMYCFYTGDFSGSLEAYELCQAVYQKPSEQEFLITCGIDPGIGSMLDATISWWITGYPDRAREVMNSALELAEQSAGKFLQIWCLCYQGWLSQFLGDHEQVTYYGNEAQRLGRENGIEYYMLQSSIMLAWVQVMTGDDTEAGISRIRDNIETHRSIGSQLICNYFLYLLADAYGFAGFPAEGLETIEEAIAHSHQSGETWWQAELYRLRGDLLRKTEKSPAETEQLCALAEESYNTALEIADRQQAKAFQLRTAISLARLRIEQGRGAEGLTALQLVYSSFTEGLETGDHRQARELLAQYVVAAGA